MVTYAEDTIAAIATPPGTGGIGIIRVSGSRAEFIAGKAFARHTAGEWETHRLYHGHVLGEDGARIDEGLAVLMRGPRSYTGEDVLELHCHGSTVVLRRTLEFALRLGARPAAPGEFTQRAFLNGRLDLAQAEAVAALVGARTGEGARQAADQLFGHLSEHLEQLREQLIGVKAHLEAQIDFADEPIDLTDSDVAASLHAVCEAIDALLRTYASGRLLREGIRLAIVGPPNVGKSSLLNALLGDERAIVTARPGTTRDVIEETTDFDGVPVVLSDTAGIHEAHDEVERIGVDRARKVAQAADMLLVVLDASVPPQPLAELFDVDHTVIVLNKSDLPCVWAQDDLDAIGKRLLVVRASAKKRTGLDAIRRAVLDRAGRELTDGRPTLTSSRQRDALAKALGHLDEALRGCKRRAAADLLAVDVQAALDDIGSVTGAVASEEVLDRIFAEFCIGK